MPSGKHKSRTFRRVFVRTPSKTKLTYRRRKPSKAKCGKCGAILKGVPRDVPSKFKKIPKTKKRPERPYGGNLCSRCMREKMRLKAKINKGEQ